ncbi:hypothetical protein [Paracoccus sp. (in: a-proteobacteria)]|uniref:hypothetical protein n=1 Tax=Paracoccus sp. TaxID=267 RepID=UPI003A87BD2A
MTDEPTVSKMVLGLHYPAIKGLRCPAGFCVWDYAFDLQGTNWGVKGTIEHHANPVSGDALLLRKVVYTHMASPHQADTGPNTVTFPDAQFLASSGAPDPAGADFLNGNHVREKTAEHHVGAFPDRFRVTALFTATDRIWNFNQVTVFFEAAHPPSVLAPALVPLASSGSLLLSVLTMAAALKRFFRRQAKRCFRGRATAITLPG